MAYRFVLPAADVGSGIVPASGARLYFYNVGTAVAKTTYSDFALSVANSDPVVADASGVFGDIFLDSQADVSLKDSSDTLIWGPKTIYAPDDSVAALAASVVTITDSAGHYSGSNVESALTEIGDEYQRADRAEAISATRTYDGTAEIVAPILTNYTIKTASISSASNVLTVDLSTANYFYTTLTENVTTLTITGVPASNHAEFTLEVTQDGAGGAYTLAQPASVIVPGGTAPVISTGNDAVDELSYRTRDGGTTWKLDFSQAYA